MRFPALLILLCASLAAQQKASVEGTAIHALTRQALPGVHIRLLTLGQNTVRANYGAESNREGRFSISNLASGTYILYPDKPGFVVASQKFEGGPVPSITLKPGEALTGFRLEMTPRAVIAGRVLDDAGDPIQGADVEAAPVNPASAQLNIFGRRSARTDDRGDYRISGVPGKYYVKVTPPRQSGQSQPEKRLDGSTDPVYSVTYYPAAAVPDRATPVESKSGEDITGIDVRLSRQKSLSLSGVVNGIPEGGSGVMVILYWGDSPGAMNSSSTTGANMKGKFTFSKLQPANYRLYAVYASGKSNLVSPPVEMRLEAADVKDVQLTLGPGGELTGTLEMLGDAPGKAEKRTVRLGGLVSMVEKDGSFRIVGLAPDKYIVDVEPLPENAYVKSMQLDGAAVAKDTLDLTAGARATTLKIVVSRNGARLVGDVHDKNGQPMTNRLCMVFLVDDPEKIGMNNTVQVDPNGKFDLKALKPGKYRLFAIDALQFAGASGPEALKEVLSQAEDLEIKEGDRIARSLVPIDKGKANAKPKP